MKALLLLLAALSIAAAPPPIEIADTPDNLARDYVRLVLETGEHDPGYVDAYFGPADLAADAKAHPRALAELAVQAEYMLGRAAALDRVEHSAIDHRRLASLTAGLRASRTRLAMLQGHVFTFEDEAEGLFGVRPALKPLSAYDPVLARVDALVPGAGPLAERVDALQSRFEIPRDRLPAVMNAAIAECRRRTLAHFALPPGERFDLGFVTAKPWSGYNYYKGGYVSRIEVNTDFPVRIGRAIDLGCHEGYPGHHVWNLLRERDLARGRGWLEMTVQPLFAPGGLIGEGSANYGIELAFPGDERRAFEARVLYPLAGLDPGEAGRLIALGEAAKALAGARFTIARDYLEHRISRATAIALTQTYGLTSAARAAQVLDFDEKYRSYVINYGLGLDMVRATVERAGRLPAARWAAMEHVLADPTIPADLARP